MSIYRYLYLIGCIDLAISRQIQQDLVTLSQIYLDQIKASQIQYALVISSSPRLDHVPYSAIQDDPVIQRYVQYLGSDIQGDVVSTRWVNQPQFGRVRASLFQLYRVRSSYMQSAQARSSGNQVDLAKSRQIQQDLVRLSYIYLDQVKSSQKQSALARSRPIQLDHVSYSEIQADPVISSYFKYLCRDTQGDQVTTSRTHRAQFWSRQRYQLYRVRSCYTQFAQC